MHWNLFSNKFAVWRRTSFLKKRLMCRCFPMNYETWSKANWLHALLKTSRYSELFWSAFFPDFHGVSLRIQSECGKIRENPGKMRTRTTPNTDSFYAVWTFLYSLYQIIHVGTFRKTADVHLNPKSP